MAVLGNSVIQQTKDVYKMFIAPSNKANQVRSFVAGRILAGWGSFFAKYSQQACAAYLKRYEVKKN
ncbi:hypothetical protein Q4574_21310 [Aliiglaciecola sp. 3_MG-2023]|uniref:hypothetical protein n=1 Tax=Aliiglaciecola sp. 3_MG-2023 TaxID=3062644 RepID=UPI0026E403DA|nr:hypothetical protein [Aliiglaciecola sp. 3_MG-2023]MDO6695849.1 hypothetical protein [Aliiglaciecola sp. 3_MG-2023]